MSVKDPIAINYSRTFGWSGSLLAELCPAPETSTVILGCNYDGGAEIGLYQTVLDERDFASALASLRRSDYSRLRVPAGLLQPEACFIDVGERHPGEELPTTRGFDVAALPAEIAALRDELEAGAIARVRSGRVRVLSATAAWQSPVFDPGEPLVGEVKLECVGALPIVVGNPLGSERRWAGLALAIRGSGRAQESVTLKAMHLRPPRGAPDSAEVTLAPGTRLAFPFEKKVYLPPGAYEGMLLYRSDASEGDPQAVRGEVWLPLGPVTVGTASYQ